MSVLGDGDQLLREALSAVRDTSWSGDHYVFSPVTGGTQATVWRGRCDLPHLPEVAVRLTPKPAALIDRIGSLVNRVEGVVCPQTLAVATLETGGRTWTVHVCTWIGKGAASWSDPFGLGQAIARLHEQLACGGQDFTDRGLSFEPSPVPAADDVAQLPAWFVARHLWRDRVLPQFAEQGARLPVQPIHGDMHGDNVVSADGGFGFIDFDKLMHAPRAFDLAKLIATGFFKVQGGEPVKFLQSRAMDLIDGYRSVQPLQYAELVAIEGFAVILNSEIARLGIAYDVASYREQADAVGSWWTKRRRYRPGNPLGIRRPDPAHASPWAQQLAFFPDAER